MKKEPGWEREKELGQKCDKGNWWLMRDVQIGGWVVRMSQIELSLVYDGSMKEFKSERTLARVRLKVCSVTVEGL